MHPLLEPAAVLFWRAAAAAGVRPATRLCQPFVPPVAARMAAMLRAGDHDTLRFTLKHLHPDARPGAIEAMLDVLEASEGRERWIGRLRAWYRSGRERQATTVMVHGLVRYGARLRGEGGVARLPPRRAEEARDAFIDAGNLLADALAAQPDNAGLLCLALPVARGLALPPSESFARFERLCAVDPLHAGGHFAMLDNLSPAAGGSESAQFAFARARAALAPEGHPLRALPVHVRFEQYARLRAADAAAVESCFLDPAAAVEVEAAWRQSVGSSAFRDENRRDPLNNLFAAALYLAGHAGHARLALAAMDGRCLAEPWQRLATTPRERAHPGWIVDRVAAVLALAERGVAP